MSLEVPNKNINILEMLECFGLLHDEKIPSGVPNGLLWFEQLVRFYVEWVLMFSADCRKFLQVRILFCFLVMLMDTLCMTFITLDIVLDFGLVRVLC